MKSLIYFSFGLVFQCYSMESDCQDIGRAPPSTMPTVALSNSDSVTICNQKYHIPMIIFHVAYCSLCARSMGADLLELCDEKDPATVANGNTTFTQRYTAWIMENRNGIMPINGQFYND
ncbi:MAG: hypothetical protein LBQ08_02525 [Holosporaceae bacterium]|jgi:hypothetical protein|nr:hypothetical protein [Holosporaceae bacterium]